jgi:hypothetical protein
MVFPDPNLTNSIQTDVKVTEVLNEGAWLRARIEGRFYKNPEGYDIHAQIGILHTQSDGLRGFFGIIKCYDEECLPASQTTIKWEYPSEWEVDFGETKTLSLSWNGGTVFTFNFNGNVIVRDAAAYPGNATNAGNPVFPHKGFGVRVSHPDPPTSGGGYIAATFDNAYKNGMLYDNFNNPSGLIDYRWWNRWELVRQAKNGVFESELARYDSNASNNMNFVDSEKVMGLQADVTVNEFVNNAAIPQARLHGSFYNDGTYPTEPRGGDIMANVGIRHNGTQPVGFYAVIRCKSDDCNLSDETENLYYYEDPSIPN